MHSLRPFGRSSLRGLGLVAALTACDVSLPRRASLDAAADPDAAAGPADLEARRPDAARDAALRPDGPADATHDAAALPDGPPDAAPGPDGPPDAAAPTDDTPLVISEVVGDNTDGLRDAAGETPDWIELYNPGPTEVSLAGWTLSDIEDTLTFGDVFAPPGGFVLVFASGGGAGVPGELHAPFRVSAEGETLWLRRPDGSLADTAPVPALGPDESWGRAQPVRRQALLGPAATVRWQAAPPVGFEAADFDDAAFAEARLPLGHDDTAAAGGEPVNAALDRPARQSTDAYDRTGAQAVDGDPLTFSHTADADFAPFVEVALDGPHAVSSVTLFNRADCCGERLYNIEVALFDAPGDDAAPAWRSEVLNPVPAGAVPGDPGLRLDLVVDPPVVADRMRVSKNATSGNEWLSLAELVVTGRPAAPYAGLLASVAPGAPLGVRAGFGVDERPTRLLGTVRYDDRVALALNGAPVATFGAPEVAHDARVVEAFTLDPGALRPGPNVLAATVDSVDADDLLLDVTLDAEFIGLGGPAYFRTPTPGAPNGEGFQGLLSPPRVTPSGGLYAGEVVVTLRGDTPGATLIYTTDGTPPTLDHGTQVASADAPPEIVLTLADTTLLRARVFAPGFAPSEAATNSYLLLDHVIRQPAQPPGLPADWNPGGAPIAPDYAMDARVVDADPEAMLAALRSLPTLSIVMAPEDLFGPMGLYLHPTERGAAWERPASVEWLLPDGTRGFAEACGVRIHGYGWRSNEVTPKHSLRLEFSRDYGRPKLEYPLFPDSPVSRFDSIVLRAGGSKTWLDFRDPAQGQYLHDAFARDTARDMGKVDGHAAFAHLYLNGLYWGLYNLVERPEADFGAEYFGGEPGEYDAINRRTVTNEAIDGTLETYDALLALADAEVSTPEGLAAVEALLDLDDLIDYMLIHQYMTNRDGPCCFSHNNMRGLRRRTDDGRFRFFVWDMEYSLWSAEDDTNVEIDVPGAISHVYARLRLNADFRARYAARAALHLGPGGALTPEATAARYEARATEIFQALLAESARWGDHGRPEPYTRDVEWRAEYDRLMTTYFPRRTAALIDQLRAAGLY